MCGLTRLLVPAFLVGLAVATLFGNDLFGWIAAGVSVGIVVALSRARGWNQTCAIAPEANADQRDAKHSRDGGTTDFPAR